MALLKNLIHYFYQSNKRNRKDWITQRVRNCTVEMYGGILKQGNVKLTQTRSFREIWISVAKIKFYADCWSIKSNLIFAELLLTFQRIPTCKKNI